MSDTAKQDAAKCAFHQSDVDDLREIASALSTSGWPRHSTVAALLSDRIESSLRLIAQDVARPEPISDKDLAEWGRVPASLKALSERMTRRDHFAAAALTGIISSISYQTIPMPAAELGLVVTQCFSFADAMLAEGASK